VRRTPRLPLEALQPYLLEAPAASARRPRTPPDTECVQPFNWRQIYGNDSGVEIEVGFGKGLFLLNAAQARPQTNFLGIEIERKYQLHTATRLAKRRLDNVRLVCGDARLVLRDYVPERSVQAVLVYFPDPWWKTRHRKRRLFTEDFAAACVRVLCPGGPLELATDVEDYFAFITNMLDSLAALRRLPPPAESAAQNDLDYLTNFERKYRKEAKPIWRAAWARAY
jgi:tRNA (guanine-N7-)-methyltransferase